MDQAQYILDKMNDVLSKDTVDAAELHVMKRQLDELIGATKGKPGATGDAGAILAQLADWVTFAGLAEFPPAASSDAAATPWRIHLASYTGSCCLNSSLLTP